MNLAGIVLSPFITLCRQYFLKNGNKKSGCVFQLRRTQPLKDYPAGSVILFSNVWKRGHTIWHDLYHFMQYMI